MRLHDEELGWISPEDFIPIAEKNGLIVELGIIKIDKYIIRDSFKNNKACVSLEYTIGMLEALELLIVVESVETEEMKTQLEEIGCHYLQSWYYSKAVPPEEFMRILQAQ